MKNRSIEMTKRKSVSGRSIDATRLEQTVYLYYCNSTEM